VDYVESVDDRLSGCDSQLVAHGFPKYNLTEEQQVLFASFNDKMSLFVGLMRLRPDTNVLRRTMETPAASKRTPLH
jgi:hypothetical protein